MEKKFIESKRCYFREIRVEDIDPNYYKWMNDPEITRFLETRFFPKSKESLSKFIRNMDENPNSLFLGIFLKKSDEYIGNIKIGPINSIHKFADTGIIIGEKQHWNKGFGSEAISAVTEFAFLNLNLNKLNAGCYVQNEGSRKAFVKAGFIEEGRRAEQWFYNGSYVDEVLLGLSKKEWVLQRGQ